MLSISKNGHCTQYYCNLQGHHLCNVSRIQIFHSYQFLRFCCLGLDCLSISRGLSLEGAELEEARDSSVLYTSSAQDRFIQIILKEETARKTEMGEILNETRGI